MKLKYIIVLFFFFSLKSQAQSLSKAATFSILTVDPSDELYTSFGHAALRLTDSIQGVDIVFNWGVFDFDTPNFYLKFAGGQLNYMLAAESYGSFMTEMHNRQTRVVAQYLNLNDSEKSRLFSLVQQNYLPENRYYKYDFFYDNCATRIRDIILEAVNRKYTLVEDKNIEKPTFRQLCGKYVSTKPWIKLGIDLLLGLPSDKKADLYNAMYLPANLYDGFKMIRKADKSYLILNEVQLLNNPIGAERKDTRGPLLILIVSALIFCAALPWLGRFSNALEGTFFTLTGLLGWLLLAMWFISDHEVMRNNLNVLWAFPLHLFYFIIIKKDSWKKIYFAFTGSLALIVLIGFPFIPQEFNILVIPVIFVLAIRAFSIAFKLDNKIRTYFIPHHNE